MADLAPRAVITAELSMDISVILCTWNNARRLALTLEVLARCTVPAGLRWELVLVNSGATEDTAMVAQQAPRALPLVYRSANPTGLSHAKNIGVSAARGSLLIFMDDDIAPSPDWILAYWDSWRSRGAGHYFGGPIESEYEERCLDGAVLRVAGHSITGVDWGAAPRSLEDHERFYPANWACPRAALGEVGGFDVQLGLDASLGRRRVGETFGSAFSPTASRPARTRSRPTNMTSPTAIFPLSTYWPTCRGPRNGRPATKAGDWPS
jgi:glycosyltransferase involved in cell wall biosynthesis